MKAIDMEGITEKVCTACKELKPLDSYYTRPNRASGYHAQCKSCQMKKVMSYRPRYADKQSVYSKVSYQRLKSEIIEAYGGSCVCCGELERDFLTIDHVNGDGAESRRAGEGLGGSLYCKLKREGFPRDRYQLLCYNCNCSKKQFGRCPHTTRHIVSEGGLDSSSKSLSLGV
jgi:hypothetical protein